MKKIFCLLSLITLSSCASITEQVPLGDNVVINENQSIKSISFHEKINPSFDKIEKCVAITIKNDNIKLSDSSRTYVGAYTGNIYNAGNSYTDVASNSKVYANRKDKLVIANGNTEIYSKFLSDYIVRFRIHIQNKNNQTSIFFDNINRAQLSTGYAENNGFTPVYTHGGAHPDAVVNMIDQVKDKIVNCLSI